MKRKPNPVPTMDSVEALDLLVSAFHIIRRMDNHDGALVDRMREQILRHTRKLTPVVGDEPIGNRT